MRLREMFPGHYRPSDEAINEAWQSSLVVPDANILLHFYRYSPNAKAALKKVLTSMRDKLWVPYQVAEEFHRNRLGVIQKQSSAYSEAAKDSQKLFEVLSSPHKHPFLSAPAQLRFEKMLSELAELLKAGEAEAARLLNVDPILAEIEVLLDDRVGPEPTPEQYASLNLEAKRRVDNDIPPGTCESKDNKRTLGDAILWQQILEHAADVDRDVIMVTDDAKDDWWVNARGQQLGPRPELVKEFVVRTKRKFWLYSAPRFIERALEHLGLQPDKAAIESARSLSLSRAARRRKSTEARYLADLASHANKHAAEIMEFLLIIGELSAQQWSEIDHPMKIPTNLTERLSDLNNRCRCVLRIAASVSNVSDPAFNAFSDQMYRLAPRKGCDLITALSRAPLKAIDLSVAAI